MNLTLIAGQNSCASVFSAARTNPVLAKALHAVPDLDQLRKARDVLVAEARSVEMPDGQAADAVTTKIYDSLFAGTGIPADAMDQYANSLALTHGYQAMNSALNDLYLSLSQQMAGAVHGGLTTMCETLNEDLKRVYGRLRQLRHAPATAEAAIDQDKIDDFAEATKLRTEYRQIREAQLTLLGGGLPPGEEETVAQLRKGWPLIGHAASLVALWPDLPEFHKYGQTQKSDGRMARLTPPWPDPNSDAFLGWLLEHPEANPWVPTIDQASELMNRITTAAKTFYDTTRGDSQEAREYEYEARRAAFNQSPHYIEQRTR